MAFTAQDAAHALKDLPRIEERLTTHVMGVTLLIWALASSSIFLVYGVLDLMALEGAWNWVHAGAWVPPVLGAMAATHHLWSAHNQALQVEDDDHRWWPAFTVLAVAAGAMLLVTEVWLDLGWGVGVAALFANGVLLAGFGRFSTGRARAIHFGFGAFMEVEAILIGFLGLAAGPAALALAGAALIGWGGAGIMLAVRG